MGIVSRLRSRFGTFASRVATVAGGVAIGQGILVAASPFVTRLYAPEDFGVLAAFMATIGVVGVVAAWRFPTAIALPKEDDDALAVLGLCLIATTITAGLTGVVAMFAAETIATRLNAPGLAAVWWAVPPGVFALGASRSLSTWLARAERYGSIGAARAVEGSSKAALQLALCRIGTGGLGLVVADLVARLAAIAVMAFKGLPLGLPRLRLVQRSTYRRLAKRYREFPLVGGPAVVLNAAGLQAPVLLLTAYFDLHVAGVYALGQRVVAMPSALVGQAASAVFVADGARLAREDPAALLRLFVSTTRKLALVIVVPMGLLALAAPWLFTVVFGDAWTESGHYVRLLAVTFGLQFVALPLAQTLSILEKQRWQLAWDSSRLIAVVVAIAGAGSMGASPRTAVLALAVVTSLAYLALHALGYIAIRRHVAGHRPDRLGPPA